MLVVDLLRKGCDEIFLRMIVEMKLKWVVYVFCNSGMFVRDLWVFEDGGYMMFEVQFVDMFLYMNYVECVVVLKLIK